MRYTPHEVYVEPKQEKRLQKAIEKKGGTSIVISFDEPQNETLLFTKDQIQRKDIKKLIVQSETPDILIVKNLSEFFNKIELEVKISNNDIFLIQAFDEERNYSESAVYTRKTGELIHEITTNIKQEEKEKDISFYSCKNNNKDT